MCYCCCCFLCKTVLLCFLKGPRCFSLRGVLDVSVLEGNKLRADTVIQALFSHNKREFCATICKTDGNIKFKWALLNDFAINPKWQLQIKTLYPISVT